ncbi:MAG: hypothetical protein EPO06_01460 [Burkholderiaceae bacterium]|nr:MAG: hypothetical protein EPO06_01460 [Burkholderiaceae bacterium]
MKLRICLPLVVLLVLNLAGCALSPPSATPAAISAIDDDNQIVLSVLQQIQRVINASPEDQRRELTNAQQVFQRDKSTRTRLQLAVLLAQPSLTGNDDVRALALLEPLRNHANTSLRGLVTLVVEQANERQRLGRKAKTLEDQLDELKAMERSLIERSTPAKK